MNTRPPSAPSVGLLGMESTGLAERAVALDLLQAISEQANLSVAFHRDLAFDTRAQMRDAIVGAPDLDVLAVSMRPTSAYVMADLKEALARRAARGGPDPALVFGGPTALAAGPDLRREFPGSLVWPGDVEAGFPLVVKALARSKPEAGADPAVQSLLAQPPRRFAMPAHHSTARCVEAGGTVWVEASRGCALDCAFCILSAENVPTTWFPRPIDDLLDEIAYLRDTFGVTDVSFSDYSAFETKAYLLEFLQKVEERRIEFTFRCDMRLGTARRFRDLLPDLRDAGLRAVFVGIESLIPGQQRLYHKGYPGKKIIDYIQSLGVFVAAGFIMLDPLYTPEEFRRQVGGVREQGLMDNIAALFKTIRIQRNTEYENVALSRGIVTGLNPDLYTYSYRCVDPRMEVVRQVVEFFHQTTKDVYYQPYIENNIRQRGDLDDRHVAVLHEITVRYKLLQLDFLDRLARVVTENSGTDKVIRLAADASRDFSERRRAVFAQTADDYARLLDDGVHHYRQDLAKFIELHAAVPVFEDGIVDLGDFDQPAWSAPADRDPVEVALTPRPADEVA